MEATLIPGPGARRMGMAIPGLRRARELRLPNVTLAGMVLAATLWGGQPAIAVQPPPVPPEDATYRKVGDTAGGPVLLAIDAEVRRYGVDGRYRRNVGRASGAPSGFDRRDVDPSDRVVIDYRLPTDERELGTGVQVWISPQTGRRFIIRKNLVGRADLQAVAAGYDLTQYSRVVERVGPCYYVTYSLRPPPSDLPIRERPASFGGVFTVTLDVRTGRPVDSIRLRHDAPSVPKPRRPARRHRPR